jgi:hypothetical protein
MNYPKADWQTTTESDGRTCYACPYCDQRIRLYGTAITPIYDDPSIHATECPGPLLARWGSLHKRSDT